MGSKKAKCCDQIATRFVNRRRFIRNSAFKPKNDFQKLKRTTKMSVHDHRSLSDYRSVNQSHRSSSNPYRSQTRSRSRSPIPMVNFKSTSDFDANTLTDCFATDMPATRAHHSSCSSMSSSIKSHCDLIPLWNANPMDPSRLYQTTSGLSAMPVLDGQLPSLSAPKAPPTRNQCASLFRCANCDLLCTDQSHNCVARLRNELKRQQAYLMSLANCNHFNDRNVIDHQHTEPNAIIHFLDGDMDFIAKIKLSDQLNIGDLLAYAIKQFKLNDVHVLCDGTQEPNYQLVLIGTYQYESGSKIHKCNRLYVSLHQDVHLRLLPKRIAVNILITFKGPDLPSMGALSMGALSMGALSIDQQSNRSKWLSIQIDPIASIGDLKQLVSDLFPLNWSQCLITFRGIQLANHHSLFAAGISTNDHLTIDHI